MLRLLPLILWAAGFAACAVIVSSDYAFGDRPVKAWLRGLALSLVWPVALLSAPGRDLLFKTWSAL